MLKININYDKDPYFIHKSLIDIISSCYPKENIKDKPYLFYFLANCMLVCDLNFEFDFSFELISYLMRNYELIQSIQLKHEDNSCYENYFNEDLGDLVLKMVKKYEKELRELVSLEILKKAASSPPLYFFILIKIL